MTNKNEIDKMMNEVNNDNGIAAASWLAQPKAKKIPDLICDVCKKNNALGVFCVPFVPISCAYCLECYIADAHPWWVLISNTACCGGLDKTADWWKWMVSNTCEHLGKTLDEFIMDVKISIQELNEYMETEKQINKVLDKDNKNG